MKNLKNDAFRRKSYNYFLYNIKKLLTGRCHGMNSMKQTKSTDENLFKNRRNEKRHHGTRNPTKKDDSDEVCRCSI